MKQCSKRYGLGCSNAESTDNRMPWIKEPCIYPRLWEDWKSSFPVTIFLRLHAIALSLAFISWIAKLSQLPACYPLWLYLSATEILSYDNLRHSSGDRESFYLLFIHSRIIYGVRLNRVCLWRSAITALHNYTQGWSRDRKYLYTVNYFFIVIILRNMYIIRCVGTYLRIALHGMYAVWGRKKNRFT